MPEQDVHRGVQAVSPEEAQREEDLRQVEVTMMEIEAAAQRAELARTTIARVGQRPNLLFALDDAIESLRETRHTLQQQVATCICESPTGRARGR